MIKSLRAGQKDGKIVRYSAMTSEVINNVPLEQVIANLREMAGGLKNPVVWIGEMGDEVEVFEKTE